LRGKEGAIYLPPVEALKAFSVTSEFNRLLVNKEFDDESKKIHTDLISPLLSALDNLAGSSGARQTATMTKWWTRRQRCGQRAAW